MNTKTILKSLGFLFIASTLSAATIEMQNGDKLSGTIKSQDDKSVIIETNYGTLNIDKTKLKGISDADIAVEIDIAILNLAAPADASAKPAGTPAVKVADAKKPATPAAKTTDAKKPSTPAVPQWIQDYRDSVNPYLGGWQLKFKGAFEHKKTNSSYTAYNFSAEAFKKINELSSIKLNAYYDYTTETPVDGASYTSTDKYGIGSLYRYDIAKDTNWYLSNELNYRVDTIKGIDNEVNEIVALGYTLKYLENDALVINMYGGPGVKYIDAENYDTPWVAIASVGEEIKWKFHEYMRLEHKMDFQLNLENSDQYFFYVMFGLAVSPSPVFDIVLRYSYQYDGINASDSLKNETRFLLGIEIPLGWDK